MRNFYQKGITLVETLVAVAIIVLILAIVLPSFNTIKKNNILKSTTEDIFSALDNAHSQTLSSVSSSTYGVHFQSDKVVIFKGTVYSSNDVNNKTVNINFPASISNVNFNSVSAISGDIYFAHLTGVPSKTGTVTIAVSSSTKIITISATGNFSIN
ncbi:MAG: type II secretion system protein [Patescibacteria group bacterium]